MMIAQLINMNKIKYVKLANMLYKDMMKPNKTGNVIIDLDSCIKRLMSRRVDEYISAGGAKAVTLEFVSSAVNLASHYREFFANNGKDVKVYLYTTFPFNDINYSSSYKFNKDYKKNYIDKLNSIDCYHVKSMLEVAIPMMKNIFNYVDGCYLITTNKLEAHMIPYYIDKEKSESTDESFKNTFIITKDRYAYQLINRGITLLRPKGDTSYKIDSSNLWETVCREERIKPITLDNSYFKFVYTILGDETRGFRKVSRIGLANISKIILAAEEKGVLPNKGNTSIFVLEKLIPEDFRKDVHNNYLCVDLDRQWDSLSNVETIGIEEQFIDKFDKPSLERLNNDYFLEYPIDIMGLLPQVKTAFVGKKKCVFTVNR